MSQKFSRQAVSTSLIALAAIFAMTGPRLNAGAIALSAEAQPELVQIALCLDTSGSMDGLLESTKQKLWAIVNELASAEPTPKLEVALLSFGNDGHLSENGWVHLDSPLTTDLDQIYERLFALTTNGGSEYVARVLYKSQSLLWDESPSVLKIAVVAGNESADQDLQFRNTDVCRELKARGILVNPIYCGPAEDNVGTSWRNVAAFSGGTFANIDQNDGLVLIETPFDEKLALYSSQLNDTYVPVGTTGAKGMANQKAQDANAASLNKSAEAARGCAKASKLYSCSWDLVDAVEAGTLDLEKVESKDLPETMRGMSLKERSAFVSEKKSAREEVQKKIAEMGRARDKFIQAKIESRGMDESLSFDAALRHAIRRQAEAKGFTFPKEIDTASNPTASETTQPTLAVSLSKVLSPDALSRSASSTSMFSTTLQNAQLFQNARIAQPLRSAIVVHVDPVQDGALAALVEAVVERAIHVRPGIQDDLRQLSHGQWVPNLVVTLGPPEDWDVLERLLDSKQLAASSNRQVWIQIGTRSYLVSNGC